MARQSPATMQHENSHATASVDPGAAPSPAVAAATVAVSASSAADKMPLDFPSAAPTACGDAMLPRCAREEGNTTLILLAEPMWEQFAGPEVPIRARSDSAYRVGYARASACNSPKPALSKLDVASSPCIDAAHRGPSMELDAISGLLHFVEPVSTHVSDVAPCVPSTCEPSAKDSSPQPLSHGSRSQHMPSPAMCTPGHGFTSVVELPVFLYD